MKILKLVPYILVLFLGLSFTAVADTNQAQQAEVNSKRLWFVIRKLEKQIHELETEVADLNNTVAMLEAETIDGLSDYLAIDDNTINGLMGPHLIITGANLHVRDGSGQTDSVMGKGNFIVGYNEDNSGPYTRLGSHNMVIGPEHTYSSYGGFVAGENNIVSGTNGSVGGGAANEASGTSSSVSGGVGNKSSGMGSSVSGGANGEASGLLSSVSGGDQNLASGQFSSVSGGASNIASGFESSALGGRNNTASGQDATVAGGFGNDTSGAFAIICGGSSETNNTNTGVTCNSNP